jgi:hypothetical protein
MQQQQQQPAAPSFSFLHACAALCALVLCVLEGPALTAPLLRAAGGTLSAQAHPVAVACDVNAGRSFKDIATQYDGGKSTVHQYHFAYEKYTRALRCKQKLSVAEIGLGCLPGAVHPPGASVSVWLEHFPSASIYLFEYDRPCAETFLKTDPYHAGAALQERVRLFMGDQSLESDLAQFQEGAPYDVIVDDGGHSMLQQITSLRYLFPLLKPGGVYFLEDLLTSYFWFDGPWHDDKGQGLQGTTTAQYISKLLDVLNYDPPAYLARVDERRFPGLLELAPLVKSVDCFRKLCVLTRWHEGYDPGHSIPQ